MSTARRSLAIYLALMVYLALVKVVLDLRSVEGVVPSQATAFSWPVIGFLTLAGACSVWLGPRVGFPGLWDPSIPARKRLLFPALAGLGLGAVNLAVMAFTGYAQTLAETADIASLNVSFPESILFYSGGAIVVESLYRLIIITLPLCLVATVILRKRGQTAVFWVVALLTSVLEPLGQMSLVAGHPSMMIYLGTAMYAMNVLEAFLFRRLGFLAPLTFRLAFYSVWHVMGGVLGL